MGIFKKLLNKTQEESLVLESEENWVYAPIEGEIIPLNDIADGVFSKGLLGKGCGIKPSDDKVYAPFDGEVIMIAATKHAIGLKSNDGIELLIHVGMDTVKMEGKGFRPEVKLGDKVKCGQLLMTFSIDDVEKAGYSTTTAVIVSNSEIYTELEVSLQGVGSKLEKLIHVS
ncbi:PTS glucose transporter subunit IIA [Niallia sp. JL1B1071]|uniref:PTS sugar transporter subunit IIA n=1 Tax=Niallia tiangongensis TaxID=3237105 RepID=UPI0037DD84F1